MNYLGKWRDTSCFFRYPALCERERGSTPMPVAGTTPVLVAGTTPVPVVDITPSTGGGSRESRIRFPNPTTRTRMTSRYNRRVSIQGYVEVYERGSWGSICDDSFDDNDAIVVCRMGGYNGGEYNRGAYKERNVEKVGRIILDDLACRGTEFDVAECPGTTYNRHNCGPTEDVGIMCWNDTPIIPVVPTLPGGRTSGIRFPRPERGRDSRGRLFIGGHVEIYHDGLWGTICDDAFDDKDAAVICRTGGHSGGRVHRGRYDPSMTIASKIWLDDLRCRGWENNVNDCPGVDWGRHNCDHHEDVSIMCFVEPLATTPADGMGPRPTQMFDEKKKEVKIFGEDPVVV